MLRTRLVTRKLGYHASKASEVVASSCNRECLEINGMLAKCSRIGKRLFLGMHPDRSDTWSLKHDGASGRLL